MTDRFNSDFDFHNIMTRPVDGEVTILRDLLVEILRYASDDVPDMPETTASGRPISVCLPDHYEPGYSYPLIVWLHGSGGSEEEVQLLLPSISDRNYIGLAIGGDIDDDLAETQPWRTDDDSVSSVLDDLHEAMDHARRIYSIHDRRIYVAGYGPGGTMALRVLLERPAEFAGSIVLGADTPGMDRPLRNFRHLRHRRVMVGNASDDPTLNRGRTAHTLRLLRTAGLEVDCHDYAAPQQITERMLSDINHWIMAAVSSAA